MTIHMMDSFVGRLSAHTDLSEEERQTLVDLPRTATDVPSQHPVVQKEQVVQHCCLVVSGLLARSSYTAEGERQITAFYVAGQMPDLHSLARPKASFALFALSPSQVLRIPHAALHHAMSRFPRIAEALFRELTRESDIASEWVVNVGRRSAKERLAHLFCEMAVKHRADRSAPVSFEFPVSQSALADATGLSCVHVNRSLQALRRDGLLRFERGMVEIPDWQALSQEAGFDRAYLEPN